MNHHTKDLACPLCEEKLADAHPDMAAWFRSFVKPKHPGAHISWTYRDEVHQEQFFREGRTRAHFPQSRHNVKPSLAMDLFLIRDDNVPSWAVQFFKEIAVETRNADYPIQWGGDWKTIGDGDHFELRPKAPDA